MRRSAHLRIAIAAATVLLGAASSLARADPAAPDPTALLLFAPAIVSDNSITQADASDLGEAFREDLRRELTDQGFKVLDPKPEAPSAPGPEAIAAAARAEGAAWAALPRLGIDRSRLSYSARIYEAGEGALAAAAAFSTFAGIGALPLLERSARTAALRASAYRSAASGASPRELIPYRITLLSPDEGAAVSLSGGSTGDEDAYLGRIAGGRLLLPYLALEPGSQISIVVSQRGKRSAIVETLAGEGEQTVQAPPLQDSERQALSIETGPGRLLGLGLGYRYFLEPDWVFLFADGRAYAGYDFGAGSFPLFHAEAWEGAGAYLVLPPASPIRAGISAGCGLLFSFASISGDERFFDLALVPVKAFAEIKVSGPMSARLSIEAAYSLGLGSGIAEMGWMGGSLPLLFSVGMAWRL
jgi:hypothetical protein